MWHIFSSKSVNSRSYFKHFSVLFFLLFQMSICRVWWTKKRMLNGKWLMCVSGFYKYFVIFSHSHINKVMEKYMQLYSAIWRKVMRIVKIYHQMVNDTTVPYLCFLPNINGCEKKFIILVTHFYALWVCKMNDMFGTHVKYHNSKW